MINLKQETMDILTKYGKNINDIKWIGTDKYYIDIDNFFKLADHDYDNGWGNIEVPLNLVIVGDDWYLKRREYDGSEWWEYETQPTKPKVLEENPVLIEHDVYNKIMNNYEKDVAM